MPLLCSVGGPATVVVGAGVVGGAGAVVVVVASVDAVTSDVLGASMVLVAIDDATSGREATPESPSVPHDAMVLITATLIRSRTGRRVVVMGRP